MIKFEPCNILNLFYNFSDIVVVVVVVVYIVLSRLLYRAFSTNLGLLCMQDPGMGPPVPSEGQRSELYWSFIWKVTHPVSDSTKPCLTSFKLMELAAPLGHSLEP